VLRFHDLVDLPHKRHHSSSHPSSSFLLLPPPSRTAQLSSPPRATPPPTGSPTTPSSVCICLTLWSAIDTFLIVTRASYAFSPSFLMLIYPFPFSVCTYNPSSLHRCLSSRASPFTPVLLLSFPLISLRRLKRSPCHPRPNPTVHITISHLCFGLCVGRKCI
jgi:hypothetical protein